MTSADSVIPSQLWSPEIQNQGVHGATLPLRDLGEGPSGLSHLWGPPGLPGLGDPSRRPSPLPLLVSLPCMPLTWPRAMGLRDLGLTQINQGFSDGSLVSCQCRDVGLCPWARKIPWRRERLPTLVFVHGKSHGQRRLVGYSS